jgi:hypothetical protein
VKKIKKSTDWYELPEMVSSRNDEMFSDDEGKAIRYETKKRDYDSGDEADVD